MLFLEATELGFFEAILNISLKDPQGVRPKPLKRIAVYKRQTPHRLYML
jgi:hypothetical protein